MEWGQTPCGMCPNRVPPHIALRGCTRIPSASRAANRCNAALSRIEPYPRASSWRAPIGSSGASWVPDASRTISEASGPSVLTTPDATSMASHDAQAEPHQRSQNRRDDDE